MCRQSCRRHLFDQLVDADAPRPRQVAKAINRRKGRYLVVTDISHYFESIRFKELELALDRLLPSKPSSDVVKASETICELLRRVSPYDGRGLPQNMDPSSFIGNVYLHGVDSNMLNDGYEMFRYMDDIRVVVNSSWAAREALTKYESGPAPYYQPDSAGRGA